MITICPKSKRCIKYKRTEPCWSESTKGMTIWCDDFLEARSQGDMRYDI